MRKVRGNHISKLPSRNPVLAELLINRDCDLSASDSKGNTAIHYACFRGAPAAEQSILSAAAKDQAASTIIKSVAAAANNPADLVNLQNNEGQRFVLDVPLFCRKKCGMCIFCSAPYI